MLLISIVAPQASAINFGGSQVKCQIDGLYFSVVGVPGAEATIHIRFGQLNLSFSNLAIQKKDSKPSYSIQPLIQFQG